MLLDLAHNNMRTYLLFFFASLFLMVNLEAKTNTQYKIPRTQVIPIQDKMNNKQYELYIKLPEAYTENKDTQYPVIYFTDAVWHIEALSAATAFLLQDAILVGISWQKDIDDELIQKYGEHASRFTDYSFWKTANPDHPKIIFGQADNHLAFIRNRVFEYVEGTYRASPENRSYFGYSLGGLFGAYTLMTQPETFAHYIIGSPSVQLLSKYGIESASKIKETNAKVFISHGDLEQDLAEHVEIFTTSLQKQNKNLSLTYEIIQGDHQSAFPYTALKSVAWLAKMLNKEDE